MTRWTKWRGADTSRRAFLGGGAAAITLPWLASLQPSRAHAEDTPPTRLLFWFAPNGMVMNHWTPDSAGALGTLPRILEPLDDLKEDILVVTGLANRAGEGDRPGDHARGTGAMLTCHQPDFDYVRNAISVDQVAAQALGADTAFPSLQLGTQAGATSGICDSGYSCAYQSNISWAGPSTPLPKLTNPTVVFERLFAGFDASLSEAEKARRKAYHTSILDRALEDASKIQQKISAEDGHRIDQYLTGIRELELRLSRGDTLSCSPPARPPLRYQLPEQVALLQELAVVSLQCDLTRFVTFMMGNGSSNQSFPFVGVSGAHHEISHHQSNADNLEKLAVIDTWEMTQVGDFLRQLKATPEGDGTLLDHCFFMMSSECSDGDRHNHDDLPVLVAGRGNGHVSPGRHVVLDETPIANLYVSMLEAAGIPTSSFANSTGPLQELML